MTIVWGLRSELMSAPKLCTSKIALQIVDKKVYTSKCSRVQVCPLRSHQSAHFLGLCLISIKWLFVLQQTGRLNLSLIFMWSLPGPCVAVGGTLFLSLMSLVLAVGRSFWPLWHLRAVSNSVCSPRKKENSIDSSRACLPRDSAPLCVEPEGEEEAREKIKWPHPLNLHSKSCFQELDNTEFCH